MFSIFSGPKPLYDPIRTYLIVRPSYDGVDLSRDICQAGLFAPTVRPSPKDGHFWKPANVASLHKWGSSLITYRCFCLSATFSSRNHRKPIVGHRDPRWLKPVTPRFDCFYTNNNNTNTNTNTTTTNKNNNEGLKDCELSVYKYCLKPYRCVMISRRCTYTRDELAV